MPSVSAFWRNEPTDRLVNFAILPPWHFLKNPLHDAGANAQLLANLEDAVAIGPKLKYSRLDRRPNPASPQLIARPRLATPRGRLSRGLRIEACSPGPISF
jgi:hypothetical protein